jgi:hypothetical protein
MTIGSAHAARGAAAAHRAPAGGRQRCTAPVQQQHRASAPSSCANSATTAKQGSPQKAAPKLRAAHRELEEPHEPLRLGHAVERKALPPDERVRLGLVNSVGATVRERKARQVEGERADAHVEEDFEGDVLCVLGPHGADGELHACGRVWAPLACNRLGGLGRGSGPQVEACRSMLPHWLARTVRMSHTHRPCLRFILPDRTLYRAGHCRVTQKPSAAVHILAGPEQNVERLRKLAMCIAAFV